MTLEDFKVAVMSQLPTTLDEQDLESTVSHLHQLYDRGFTVQEAVRYTMCSEHCNPQLDEDIALRRMKAISDAVAARGVQHGW